VSAATSPATAKPAQTQYASFGDHLLRIGESVVSARSALPRFEGRRIILGIRPEDLEDAAVERDVPDERRLSAVVDIREDMGSEVFVHFAVGARAVRGEDVRAAVGEDAIEARQVAAETGGSLFVARVDRATRAAEGRRIELAVDTGRLHFFDPASGAGIYDEA
jgi:multiple sugar transport system ATP-binding protein